MDVAVWAVIGYLAGALPSAWLAAVITGRGELTARMRRDAGEADAHIVLRDAGAGRVAALAGTADVLKAFIPVLLASRIAGPYAGAACGIAAVAGHCWPPVARRFGGRGLSAAAGVFLALAPVEMTIAGIITAGGIAARVGGLASSVGFVCVPVVAGLRHQPFAYRFAAWVIVVMIAARRLEGVEHDVQAGVPPVRAWLRRALLDVSGPPRPRERRARVPGSAPATGGPPGSSEAGTPPDPRG